MNPKEILMKTHKNSVDFAINPAPDDKQGRLFKKVQVSSYKASACCRGLDFNAVNNFRAGNLQLVW